MLWHVLAGIALRWQRLQSKSNKQHDVQLSIKIQPFFISWPSNCITIQRAYSCVMYVALSKLALGTHLGGKRERKKNTKPKTRTQPQNFVRWFIQSQYLWSRNSLGGIHAVSVPQAVPLLPQRFLEFHTSESANNFTKAANVPGTCPDHVSHIHCLEGSKLTLKNNFLNIILLFSHCLESSIVELQHGEKSTNLWWVRRCRARRTGVWILPLSLVLNGGGYLGCRASLLEASSHMLHVVASSTTYLHYKHCYLCFPTDKSLI